MRKVTNPRKLDVSIATIDARNMTNRAAAEMRLHSREHVGIEVLHIKNIHIAVVFSTGSFGGATAGEVNKDDDDNKYSHTDDGTPDTSSDSSNGARSSGDRANICTRTIAGTLLCLAASIISCAAVDCCRKC